MVNPNEPRSVFPMIDVPASLACVPEPHAHVDLGPGLHYCHVARMAFACPVKMQCPEWVYAGEQDDASLTNCIAHLIEKLIPGSKVERVGICAKREPH